MQSHLDPGRRKSHRFTDWRSFAATLQSVRAHLLPWRQAHEMHVGRRGVARFQCRHQPCVHDGRGIQSYDRRQPRSESAPPRGSGSLRGRYRDGAGRSAEIRRYAGGAARSLVPNEGNVGAASGRRPLEKRLTAKGDGSSIRSHAEISQSSNRNHAIGG